ncbi:MAG: hypothetical protein LBG87_00705 [Spirochaetaceae bacterium]|jgi:hypothetical protein|nr:hypothetical protein [Spirochaetaceae bacterium]
MITIFLKNARKGVGICALAGMAAFMLTFASAQSFWVDELDWMIGIITGKSVFNGRLFTGMLQILLETGYNLPLYYLIEKPFYELMPYGEAFLLIPSIIFVIAGIVILKRLGTFIGGETMGFAALCAAVTSAILITQGGWEIRPYSITFCFSAFALYRYVKRLKTETNKNILLYGLSLIPLLFSHWFGSILALCYAFTDLLRYIRKKTALRCIFSYLLAGAFIIPWFLLMLFYHISDLSSYWGKPPSIIAPIKTIAYLLSFRTAYCLCFGVGFIVVIGKAFKRNAGVWPLMIVSVMWVIAPVWIYSKFINPAGAFYADRYFFALMPHIFLITGYGFLEIFRAVENHFFAAERGKNYFYSIIALLFCAFYFQTYQSAYRQAHSIREPYREIAAYLAEDPRIYADNTLVINSGGSAWIEYYFRKRGVAIPAAVCVYSSPAPYRGAQKVYLFIENGEYVQPTLLTEEKLAKYEYIYLAEVHGLFTEAFIGAIEKTYRLKEEKSFKKEKSQLIKPGTKDILKRIVKDALRINASQPKTPFGLRLYAKIP